MVDFLVGTTGVVGTVGMILSGSWSLIADESENVAVGKIFAIGVATMVIALVIAFIAA